VAGVARSLLSRLFVSPDDDDRAAATVYAGYWIVHFISRMLYNPIAFDGGQITNRQKLVALLSLVEGLN